MQSEDEDEDKDKHDGDESRLNEEKQQGGKEGAIKGPPENVSRVHDLEVQCFSNTLSVC